MAGGDPARMALADTLAGEPLVSVDGSGERERDGAPSAFPPRSSDRRQAEALIGCQVDHFHIESVLGVGGMGTVYGAQDTSLDRPVALKMLREVFRKPAHEERLKREARAQAKLQSPHVVGIHYIGRTGFVPDGRSEPPPGAEPTEHGMLYFAMERIDGGSLEAVLERGETLEPEVARRMMLQIARGLRAAHRAGILHRDIKPSNILRGADGVVKIADFGLAKPVSAEESIHDGTLVGSPFYMSPEQCQGETLDHRSDMYSLGATFHHLLGGEPPFGGSSIMEVVQGHLGAPVPTLPPTIPPKLARVIARLLAKDPADRYPDHDALIDALKAAAPERAPYAGFWIRATATLLDTIVAGVLIALLGWWGMILHLVHVTAGHATRGQTLAKYLLKIQVRRTDGHRLGWGRALARTVLSLWMPLVVGMAIFAAYGFDGVVTTIEQLRIGEAGRMQTVILSLALGNGLLSLLYGAGLALAAFHPQKRSVHDLITGTVVRYRLPS
tara:strand:- start:533 stop:2032 length:1500 start_codon:yes stop_codon:yes gene_type:complete